MGLRGVEPDDAGEHKIIGEWYPSIHVSHTPTPSKRMDVMDSDDSTVAFPITATETKAMVRQAEGSHSFENEAECRTTVARFDFDRAL